MTDMTKQTEAISTERALKLALEALTATMATHGFQKYIDQTKDDAITALEAIEQPAPATELREQEQEPGRNHYEDGDVFERIAAMKTQPAQRTWVGLTDEDIASLDLSAVTVKDAISDVRAVEAKLKEKNA